MKNNHETKNNVQIKCIAENGSLLPCYKTNGASGADVCAYLPNTSIKLSPGQRYAVPTGLKFEIPLGFEIQVRPRSGLALKNGVTCLNTPGTIDSDYRGEVKIILINLGEKDFIINDGDRIAQLIVSPVWQGEFIKAVELSETNRGSGGFGSTGVSNSFSSLNKPDVIETEEDK